MLAGLANQLWDQLQVLVAADVGKIEVDPYVFTSLRTNANRLENALDSASGLALKPLVAGGREHAGALYTAFVQALADAAARTDPDPEPWLKQHLLMGMVRLLDTLARDKRTREAITARLAPSIIEEAWTYLAPDRRVSA